MDQPSIRIETIDLMKVMYVRFKGSYVEYRKNSKKMYHTLVDYATKHQLIIEGFTYIMSIYHDNPFITKDKDLRTSMAMIVPNIIHHIESDEIGLLSMQGKYAIGRFSIKINEYEEAWKYMYHEWLFKSNDKPRDTFPFEVYITPPPRNYKDKSIVDIYIPIES